MGSEDALDMLLTNTREELQRRGNRELQPSQDQDQNRTISDAVTQTGLVVERAILAAEQNMTQKIENELWIGAHLVTLPFFYDTYTINAHIGIQMQTKYDQAIISTCSRFKAMGTQGIALVSPITQYIRTYKTYSKRDRVELEDELIMRVYTWLKDDFVLLPEAQNTPSQSLERIMSDIEHAEETIDTFQKTNDYMEGEVQLATIAAIAHTDFLPAQVKYALLTELKKLSHDQVVDIGTFLLWEMRKSHMHHNVLLYNMLRIFKKLSDSVLGAVKK